MTAKSPIESVPLETGEVLSFTREGVTFHRSFDYSLAASDRAVYFYVWGLRLRPRWVRIPLQDIESVVIAPFFGGRTRAVCVVVVMFVVVVGAHLLNHAWWVAFVFAAFITYLGYLSIKSLPGRTEMIVKKRSGWFAFRSPEDTYAEEKKYDRKFVLELGEVLQGRGIIIDNRCAVAQPGASEGRYAGKPASRP